MSTADGTVVGTTKLVDHGPNADRYNIVVVGDGYRAAEMAKYHADVQAFVATLHATAPFGDLWCAINVHRVDVTSTDSGADDPAACGDGSVGAGAAARTYFDATFCSGGAIRRLLTCNSAIATSVAQAEVPEVHMTMCIVNTSQYGGSGGVVATFSTSASAAEIALHEMGHTAFGLADEYEYYAGCGSGEAGHDMYSGAEPVEPNVARNTGPFAIKWRSALTVPTDALPTTSNASCSQCDPQPNPKPASYVGAYAGARYFHCGCFRPSYDCRMRSLGTPFCAVCQQAIRDTLQPYVPAAFQGLWWAAPAGSESGWGLNVAHQEDVIFATWFTYDPGGRPWWISMTAPKAAASNTYTGTFQYTVNGVSQVKAITRQIFASPVPTCRFGLQPDLARATNYQDLWWASPAGSESGWGVNVTHQGNILFATWFTYDATGAPWWLSVTANMTSPGVYTGTLHETHGPAFSAVPFSPAAVTATAVGTATFTFTDGNRGTFAYVVNGVAGTKPITRQVFRNPGTVCQ